jgi:type II secretory pathway pseudopilin PulG
MKKHIRQFSEKLVQQEGITLIEVLMAMVILGVGIFAIVALQTRDMAYNNASKRQAEGYSWAMAHVEWLKTVPYTDALLNVQGSPNVAGDGHTHSGGANDWALPANTPYTFEWDVTAHPDFPDPDDDGAKLVTIFVRWNNAVVAQVEFTKTKSVY